MAATYETEINATSPFPGVNCVFCFHNFFLLSASFQSVKNENHLHGSQQCTPGATTISLTTHLFPSKFSHSSTNIDQTHAKKKKTYKITIPLDSQRVLL